MSIVLRIVVSKSAANALDYFTKGLSREDYYTSEREIAGQWFGQAAKSLGLTGKVERPAFAALCENRHPRMHEQLTPRTKPNRRVGYDFNFHCPKSVSVLHCLGYDERILEVFHNAVRSTMTEVELDAHTRVRMSGANTDRHTGNLAWAEFTHFTARPVAGVVDPHLHAHCYTFNLTFDAIEKRWKAAQFGGIKTDAPFYESRYMGRLAEGLRDLGYDIVEKGPFWEVAGVPISVIEKYSNRTKQIERVARERGITNQCEKSGLGARTRRAKHEERMEGGRREVWLARLDLGESDSLRGPRLRQHEGKRSSRHAREAVELALGSVFERSAVVPERLLVKTAVKQALGRATVAEIEHELSRTELIRRVVDGTPMVTTREVLAEESKMIGIASKGRGRFEPILNNFTESHKALTKGQANAVRQALGSRDFVTIIDGKAGTGKTTLLKALDGAIGTGPLARSRLYLSPSTRGRDRLKESGFGDAATVAAFLARPEEFPLRRGGMVVVDEAGLLGTKGMLSLLERCNTEKQRVVLVGDSRQHTSQSRGSPLRSLREHAGVPSAVVDEIVRQRGALLKVATALSQGKVREGIEKLDAMGSLHGCSQQSLAKEAANDYLDSVKQGRSTLLITPSRQEREAVEPAIRDSLLAEKSLGKATTVEQLKTKEMSETARGRAESYQKGDVIQFIQNTKRGWFMPKGSHFQAGTRWEVVGHDPLNHVVIQRIQGLDPFGKVKVAENFALQHLPLAHAAHFQVFSKDKLEVRVGERIRLTANGRTHSVYDKMIQGITSNHRLPKRELVNGTEHAVKRITREGHLQLENGLLVRKDFGHIEYGYCTTSVRAQGANIERVILVESARSGRAAHCRQVYVSLTRGANSVAVYTDDKNKLLERAEREAKDWTATDLSHGKEPPDLVNRHAHLSHGSKKFVAEKAKEVHERDRT